MKSRMVFVGLLIALLLSTSVVFGFIDPEEDNPLVEDVIAIVTAAAEGKDVQPLLEALAENYPPCGGEATPSAFTPAPSSPPTSSAEVVATSTPAVPALEVVNYTAYEEEEHIYVVGEVQNNSDSPMRRCEAIATLYDRDGKVAGTGHAYVAPVSSIAAGGTYPFDLYISDPREGGVNLKFQIVGEPTNKTSRQDVVVLSHELYSQYEWALALRGEVQNSGSEPADTVCVTATLRDKQGNVIGMLRAYSMLDPLPPGAVSPFDSGLYKYWDGLDHYDLQIRTDLH